MSKIIGKDRVAARLSGLAGQQTLQRISGALFAGGEVIRAEAQHMIVEGSVSGKNHVPSAPGEPPSNDSGVLATHIETTQPEPLKVEVSSNAPYAAALEYGTSRMLPRPYMGPAARRSRKEVVNLVRSAINSASKRGR